MILNNVTYESMGRMSCMRHIGKMKKFDFLESYECNKLKKTQNPACDVVPLKNKHLRTVSNSKHVMGLIGTHRVDIDLGHVY